MGIISFVSEQNRNVLEANRHFSELLKRVARHEVAARSMTPRPPVRIQYDPDETEPFLEVVESLSARRRLG